MRQIYGDDNQTTSDIGRQSAALTTAVGVEFQTAVAAATESDLELARSELSRAAGRHKNLAGLSVAVLSIFTVVFTITVQWMIRKYGDNSEFWDRQFMPLTIANLVCLIGAAGGLVWTSGKRAKYARKQAKLLVGSMQNDSIGALIDLFNIDDLESHREAKAALTQMLPGLRSHDARILTKLRRDRLNHVLAVPPEDAGHKDLREWFVNTTEREVQFRLAILKAYEQVGDAEALPIVQRLASAEGGTPASRRVQEAAQECLPYLRIRVEKQTDQGSLLRGSGVSAVPGETLLRAAVESRQSTPFELLRPSDAVQSTSE